MKVAILCDHEPESSLKWEIACRNKKFEYLAIDMLRSDWLLKLKGFNPDFCVSRPPGAIRQQKNIFDEKLYFLTHSTAYQVFPGFLETYIYENKSSLSWFLEINKIPHPKTFVSADKKEANEYIKAAIFPIVAKTFIGAAGSGVQIIHDYAQASDYLKKAFSSGIKRRYGPNRKTGSPKKWLRKAINSPSYFFKKLQQYKESNQDVQKNIVLFQEYIPHNYEWRCVRIGESYFAYKKLKIGNQASGSKEFEYGAPPIELLNFTRELCEKFSFNFMAVDLFYNNKVIYVNELQTIFGHKNAYICKVGDKAGRYRYTNNEWKFEECDFNTNESYDLRLETAIKLYEQSKTTN